MQRDHVKQPPPGGQPHPSAPKFQLCQGGPGPLLTINGAEVIVEVGCAGCSSTLHQKVPIGVRVAGHQRHLMVVIRGVGSWWRWGQPKETSLLQVLVSHCRRRGRGEKHGEKVPATTLDLGADAGGPVSLPHPPSAPAARLCVGLS